MTATLRRYLVRPDPRPPRCEMCGEPVGDEHGHVADLGSRSILCTCPGCRLLFTRQGAGAGRYRAVPTRYRHAPTFAAGAELLAAADIPVGLAFFVNQEDAVSAFYPSPAGATECQLPAATRSGSAFAELAGELGEALVPEVEGLLVHEDSGEHEGFLLPIDACYRLVGELRLHWRGFDGGQEARVRLAEFLTDARRRSRTVGGARHG